MNGPSAVGPVDHVKVSPDRAIRVVVLYPEVMDVYADRGNLLAVITLDGTELIDITNPAALVFRSTVPSQSSSPPLRA